MATEPKAPAEPELSASPIENEIAAYRAISPLALTALGLGVLSVFSFASPYFLVAGALGVACGLLAKRKIRRMPDVLTGRGFADAGIGLSLVFCLASVTISYVSDFMLRREAANFSRQVIRALETRDVGQALLMKIPYKQRKEMTPEQALEQMEGPGMDRMMKETQLGPINALHDRLKQPGGKVEFERIEELGMDRISPIAAALLRVHGHAHDAQPNVAGEGDDEFALLELRADALGQPRHWHVSELLFPYKPNSYVIPTPKPDDGHGHAH